MAAHCPLVFNLLMLLMLAHPCAAPTGRSRDALLRTAGNVSATPLPPGSLGPPRKLMGWRAVCRHTRQLPDSEWGTRPRLIDALLLAVLPPASATGVASPPLSGGRTAELLRRRALASTLSARLTRDLHARGVLCDASAPCAVHVSPSLSDVTVCLPDAAMLASVCEPHGSADFAVGMQIRRTGVHAAEPDARRRRRLDLVSDSASAHVPTMRTPPLRRGRMQPAGVRRAASVGGGAAANLSAAGLGARHRAGCFGFDLLALGRWWRAVRTTSPLWRASSDLPGPHNAQVGDTPARAAPTAAAEGEQAEAVTLDMLLRQHFGSRRGPAALAEVRALLRAAEPDASGLSHTPPPFAARSCAVVGSGHSLRCARGRDQSGRAIDLGAEIDAHELVLRSNSAQLHAAAADARDGGGVSGAVAAAPAALGGARTDVRLSCLPPGRPEWPRHAAALRAERLCVLPAYWWERRSTSTTLHPCCEPPSRGDYSPAALRAARAAGVRLAWQRPQRTARHSLDFALRGTGGSALHLALGLCERVDVYGVGLFSTAPARDKTYGHYYDEGGVAPRCAAAEAARARGLRVRSPGAQRMGTDRLLAELHQHLLHALGMTRWRA